MKMAHKYYHGVINLNKDWTEVTKRNSEDITSIKEAIDTIKNNHLHHIETDVAGVKKDLDHLKADLTKQDKKIDKMDNRIWWVLGILVVSTVIGMLKNGL